jgi:hypothetical protein
MSWKSVAATAVALLAPHVSAQNMLRFGCSQLVIERTDPIVQPGMAPSSHTHQIVGGNSFNISVCRTYPPPYLLVKNATILIKVR